ncbi:MAG: SpoIIE family protein phosphatase [Bacteroidetes bacterium]|nr:SpoIIE family protein phosphatase [Bacteroidota bacterium]
MPALFADGIHDGKADIRVSQDGESSLKKQLTETTMELQKQRNIGKVAFTVLVISLTGLVVLSVVGLSGKSKKKHLQEKINILRKQIDDEIIHSEQLEEIIKELEKLSIVTRKSDNAIVIFDAGGEIEWVNESFTQLYGYTFQEFIAERGYHIVQASYSKEIKEKIQTCTELKKPQRYITRSKNKFGIEIWVQTTLTPVFKENGELHKLIAIDSDITKLKQTEEKLILQQLKITDSLEYARRIQEALQPKWDKLRQHFPDSFIFYRPKEIVSGDFYWFHHNENKSFIAVADCTGHGVPGAFMSLIGSNLLNQIVIEHGLSDTAEILRHLNREITTIMDSNRPDSDTLDGMDISLCMIDHGQNSMTYSGAIQHVCFVSNGKINDLKGDRISIGISPDIDIAFSKQESGISSGDILYLYTDGYIDQFGGEYDKKFLTMRFRELLADIHTKEIGVQEDIVRKTFYDWQGANPQVDDVLVLAIRY